MRAARWLVLGSALVLGACQEVTEPTQPFEPQTSVDQQRPGDEQAELARAVPGFGGFYIDESGRPTAYLVDRGQAGMLRARIGMLSAMRGRSPDELVILPARFPYAQLEAAFARASQAAFALDGTVFSDLDETRNMVVVGVEREALVNGARAALARAGLTAGSYDVIVSQPIYQVATLRDEVNPTVGGLQIHFTRYLCSIGANVYDGTERSFVTASHCTAKQGGVEGTVYYQPTSSVNGTVIATEVEDPRYFSGANCYRGRVCRYSDASRALYAGGQTSANAIAQTSGANNGSLAITGSFNVTGEGNTVVGDEVNKVGRTTGWTQSKVTRNCVDTGVSGSKIVLLCQQWVESTSTVLVGGGDSGSSVFTGGNSSVSLVGILWGGSSDGRTFIFSPWSGVERELGNLSEK